MGRMESPEENYQRISARLSGSRLEQFEAYLEEHDASKSDVIRKGIDAVVSRSNDDHGLPLAPPSDDRLEHAYRRLCAVANKNGIVRGDSARRVCSGGPESIGKAEVPDLILRPLSRRGYVRRRANIYGGEAYKLVGWER